MEHEGKTLWGGRFKTTADEVLWRYNASISLCKRLWREDILGSQVYAQGLEKINIITSEELTEILNGLEKVKNEWESNSFKLIPSDEDIHTANERRLCEIIPKSIGAKLHTARSRNDQVQTDVHLWLRSSIEHLMQMIKNVLLEICSLAEEHINLLMPSYTHFQPAQIIRFSHWLMNHAEALRANLVRFEKIDSHHWCPLGAGAIAGNALGIDRDFIAKELGFLNGPSLNSINSTGSREAVMDFLYASSSTFLSMSRLCEDFIIFSSPQFKFFFIGQEFCTGSSLMPQKQNPDALELIRGKCGTAAGKFMGFFTSVKGIPSGYNKDLQEDKSCMFSINDDLVDALTLVKGIIASIKPNTTSLNAAITADMMATDIAYYAVRQGIPFRDAHSIAGQVVAKAEELNVLLDQLPAVAIAGVHPCFGDGTGIIDLLKSPTDSVEQYTSVGGTARVPVLACIKEIRRIAQATH